MDIVVDRQRARLLLASLSLVALCVVAGAEVDRYPITYVLVPIGLAAMVAVARWNRGVLGGILVLLLLQGVPFINTQLGESSARGSNALNDAIFVALITFFAACAIDTVRNAEHRRLVTLAAIWSSCYLAWWGIKVIVGSPGIPVLAAVQYGREFMAFSLLLPLALLALRERSQLVGFAITLGIGAAIFSVGQIITQFTHAHLTWLIHASKLEEFQGITRIYAPMSDLLTAAFPMALAAVLLGPRPWRRRAMLLAFLTGLANALSFTRAIYVSELFAFLLISLIWIGGTGWQPRRIKYTFALVLVGAACALAVAASQSATSGTSSSPITAVMSRVALGVSNIENQGGTAGYRLREAHLEFEVLGDHWITGLGFLSPAYHYVPGLREGSIRDDDLGSLSIVMTMGLVGLLLAYMPPIYGLAYLLRRRRDFVQYGGAMYLGAALIGSITLGAVSTLSGLLVLASMLALCLNWTALDGRHPDPRKTASDRPGAGAGRREHDRARVAA
jgi:hypothetical protein